MPSLDEPPKQRRAGLAGPPPTWLIVAIVGVLLSYPIVAAYFANQAEVTYSDFKRAVKEDRVVEVRVASDAISGVMYKPGSAVPPIKPDLKIKPVDPNLVPFRSIRVSPDEELLKTLESQNVRVIGVEASDWTGSLFFLALLALPLIFLFSMGRRMKDAQSGFMAIGKSKAKIAVETDVKTTFKDVAGVDEAKAELQEVVDYLRYPMKYERLGGRMPKGILLVGPPGTGKTLLAKAIAGEAGVPFFFISGSEFVEMFVGVGASRVRDLFEQARKKAPCIVFIDELDALGRARGSGPMAHEEREQTLNQLLVELDGFDSRSGVILMAATNRPEILDPALLRAGRFDRNVLVDRPERIGRRAILAIHAQKVPMEDPTALDELAAMTPGFAGADLANLINEAALLAVRRGRETVGRDELLEAVERVIAGLEKKNRTLMPKERETVAHHEVGHALVALSLPGVDPVRKISIIPRGIAALGYTLQVPTEDRFLMTQRELENKIAVLLGGRIAEELVTGEISTGASDDIQKATDIARRMVTEYGMSQTLGRASYQRDQGPTFMGGKGARGDHSEETAREIDVEIRDIIDQQYQRAREILRSREGVLRSAAKVLLERETITGEELIALAQSQTKPTVRAAG